MIFRECCRLGRSDHAHPNGVLHYRGARHPSSATTLLGNCTFSVHERFFLRFISKSRRLAPYLLGTGLTGAISFGGDDTRCASATFFCFLLFPMG